MDTPQADGTAGARLRLSQAHRRPVTFGCSPDQLPSSLASRRVERPPAGGRAERRRLARVLQLNGEGVAVPLVDDVIAARAALRGLEGAVARHLRDRADARDPRRLEVAFASLVESTWWIASLDGHLWQEGKTPEGERYRRLRDGDTDGRYVSAMIWARDRHYHQLPFSAEVDETPFFGSRGGPPFHISSGLIWRTSAELAADGERRSPAGSREAFDRYVAGKKTGVALSHCLQWFQSLTQPPHDYLPAVDEG